MKETYSTRALWNEAGKAGLVLGLVCVVYAIVVSLLSKLSGGAGVAFLLSVLKFVLWAGKFGGCIFLMAFFMKKFAAGYDGVDNKRSFRFGMAVAALSALICAAFSLAQTLLINPDEMKEAMNAAISSYSSMLDSNSMAAMDKMMENLPQLTFFTNLIYCFLFGTVVSAILSRNIPANDVFADMNNGQNQQ